MLARPLVMTKRVVALAAAPLLRVLPDPAHRVRRRRQGRCRGPRGAARSVAKGLADVSVRGVEQNGAAPYCPRWAVCRVAWSRGRRRSRRELRALGWCRAASAAWSATRRLRGDAGATQASVFGRDGLVGEAGLIVSTV